MKKKGSVFFALLILLLTMANGSVFAATASEKLSEAERQMKELEKQLDDAKQLISSLEGSKADIESRVAELDKQLSAISSQINDLSGQLDEKTAEIDAAEEELEKTGKELEAAQADADDQYADMKLRIQYMYENSTASDFLNLFYRSGSMTEFLSAVEYIRQLSEYDRDMLNDYQEKVNRVARLKDEIEEEKQALEEDRNELAELKAVAEEQKATVAALDAAKKNELMQVNTYIDQAENTAEAYENEIAAQNEVIAEIRAEIAREEAKKKAAAENGETYEERNYDGGAFLWPCPASHRVTSDYGLRSSPTAGASTNHKGIDIGAPYGSPIVAAAPGEVTFAGYSSGAGNYVIINHGSGLRTVYMHASSLNVSPGQTVAAGDTVAFVGSTGISTGNHLHFGVSQDGEYVSPWNYLGS